MKLPVNTYDDVARSGKVVGAACQFGKYYKRPYGASKNQPKEYQEIEFKKGDMFPGQLISVGHYVSTVIGRLYSSRGGPKGKTWSTVE